MSVYASSAEIALVPDAPPLQASNAVPLLASFKIVCDRIRPLMALGHFVGGENHSS